MTEASRGSISTILFTDIVDSTALMQRLGDERAQRVFGPGPSHATTKLPRSHPPRPRIDTDCPS